MTALTVHRLYLVWIYRGNIIICREWNSTKVLVQRGHINIDLFIKVLMTTKALMLMNGQRTVKMRYAVGMKNGSGI